MRPATLAETYERIIAGADSDRALAEYLARQYELPSIPSWAFEPVRYLDDPWHASSIGSAGMREYLTYSSPAEFASRNILTEERPLRRARSGLKAS